MMFFIINGLIGAWYVIEARPFVERNSFMVFNEIIVIICGYLALTISYIDNDPDFNNNIGWVINAVLFIFSVVNFAIITSDAYSQLKKQYRQRTGVFSRCKKSSRYGIELDEPKQLTLKLREC